MLPRDERKHKGNRRSQTPLTVQSPDGEHLRQWTASVAARQCAPERMSSPRRMKGQLPGAGMNRGIRPQESSRQLVRGGWRGCKASRRASANHAVR